MKIRGERECTECGTRWSYYETGNVSCPHCGTLRSVGLDERTEHTDLQIEFDLTPVRNAVEDSATDDLAKRCRERSREYVRQRGFINGGDLRELDDTYLAAAELVHVADVVARERQLAERDELYFLTLLEVADQGRRPPASEVPNSLRSARGIAVANAVRDYRRDIRTWSEERTLTTNQQRALETLGDHVTRIRMLEGDIRPETAETLVRATRELAAALQGETEAIERATQQLEALEFE
ncbi:DUF7117 family protein [Halostagnicola kamekurae]|uniref:TFIIB-type zinc ribbon-containing protein n=1 Tax=Halostagnicola kamekurae TaxID=619731 RepID=A0A1I6QU07_9EURY|nr:hypothetical protein [Halostagnicola kamekurae]SFS55842.1 hypothetical protein SAMN04488556_1551 [Halostagnicola kamekurae]